MMKVFLVVAALVAYCSASRAGDLRNVEAAWAKYKAHYPVDAKNYAKRKANFVVTNAFIEEHNKKNSTFQMDHNIFSVMSDDEKKAYLGAFPPEASAKTRFVSDDEEFATTRQATSVDLRTNPCMQPIKNQGSCASSWAFAATAVTEFHFCRSSWGFKTALSEQELLDCSPSNKGCNGGWYHKAWIDLSKTKGQSTADSYPYKANQGRCEYGDQTAARPSPYTPFVFVKNMGVVMKQLALNRLFSFTFAVTRSFFSYKSGVYTEPNCGTNVLGYHAVTAVGYGSLKGVDYWIIRNSWGTGWGSAGYVLFQRGVNLCRIEDWAATNVVTRFL